MKALKNLMEAKQLSKKEQQEIKGGFPFPQYACEVDRHCPKGMICYDGICTLEK